MLLTPAPVTLENVITFVPKEPLSAITTGASLEIDVSNILTKSQKEGIPEFRERVGKLFPANTLSASLVQENGEETSLLYSGSHLFNNKSTMLSLYSESGVPTDQKFVKVVVKSKIKLEGVTIRWKNYKH